MLPPAAARCDAHAALEAPKFATYRSLIHDRNPKMHTQHIPALDHLP